MNLPTRWMTKEGTKVRIDGMTSAHIANCYVQLGNALKKHVDGISYPRKYRHALSARNLDYGTGFQNWARARRSAFRKELRSRGFTAHI